MTDKEIAEMNKKYDGELIAKCLITGLDMVGRKIAQVPAKTEAEKRREFEISRFRSLLIQYQR